MARRVLAVVACAASARALVAPAVQPARAAPARTPRAATLTEVETKEALPLSSVVLDEEEERRLRLQFERELAAARAARANAAGGGLSRRMQFLILCVSLIVGFARSPIAPDIYQWLAKTLSSLGFGESAEADVDDADFAGGDDQ